MKQWVNKKLLNFEIQQASVEYFRIVEFSSA